MKWNINSGAIMTIGDEIFITKANSIRHACISNFLIDPI